MADIYSFVGARIRAERKARKMTLEELASAAGMNTSFLHSIETAKKKLSLNMAQKIADALLIPIERLFAGAPTSKRDSDLYVGKLAAMVKDADSRKKQTILRVVKTLLSDAKS
ncbi:MAG: helix-turn-helix transcriptional regulator [Elusimicrobia bacterium]|nr:helix-turn-helix transcriptional regulator [Elusimicrobiota bacterium]